NIRKDFVTLHVGAGTFKPVKSETMQEHEMHAEYFVVSKETINNIIGNLDKTIVAVGTTSLRTIESLYWLGMMKSGNRSEEPGVSQWLPYETEAEFISPKDALNNLLYWMTINNQDRIISKTQIIIAPGYEFKIVKGLVTNFHQPQSTLLLLVSAFIGKGWKEVYDYALKNNFRFLSYGDGSLLWNSAKD
ncbi:MAG: S-adenosylmethionine:tRNA ribosyltransferase-isomerase, partial [Bacteroidota bacterium]